MWYHWYSKILCELEDKPVYLLILYFSKCIITLFGSLSPTVDQWNIQKQLTRKCVVRHKQKGYPFIRSLLHVIVKNSTGDFTATGFIYIDSKNDKFCSSLYEFIINVNA